MYCHIVSSTANLKLYSRMQSFTYTSTHADPKTNLHSKNQKSFAIGCFLVKLTHFIKGEVTAYIRIEYKKSSRIASEYLITEMVKTSSCPKRTIFLQVSAETGEIQIIILEQKVRYQGQTCTRAGPCSPSNFLKGNKGSHSFNRGQLAGTYNCRKARVIPPAQASYPEEKENVKKYLAMYLYVYCINYKAKPALKAWMVTHKMERSRTCTIQLSKLSVYGMACMVCYGTYVTEFLFRYCCSRRLWDKCLFMRG